MKKHIFGIITVLSFIAAILYGGQTNARAYELPKVLRIGLAEKYKEADSIKILNDEIKVGYEQSGEFIECGSFSASDVFTFAPANLYYVKIKQEFNNFVNANSFYESFKSAGHKAVYCLTGINKWSVYLGGFSSDADARNASKNISAESEILPPNNKRIVLMDGGNGICLFEGSPYYPQVKAKSGNISLSGRDYRNRVEFGRYEGKKITAVSVVTMDEYLYSTVGSEMPSSWHIEALKAQTCAARSYSVTRMGVHKDSGYDLCDTVHCQVYLGASNEAESVRRAVDETKDILILYNGEPINAVFFSSSGGSTDDSENVWTNAVPYLRGVKEINEQNAKQWSRTFTLSEITAILQKNGDSIGTATGVYIASKTDSGRVLELVITGTAGKKSLTKESIRTYFSQSAGGSLDSRNFVLSDGSAKFSDVVSNTSVYIYDGKNAQQKELGAQYIVNGDGKVTPVSEIKTAVSVASKDSKSELSLTSGNSGAITGGVSEIYGATVTFMGKGWGHGVGMSQNGAKGMAEIGYTYEQILKTYYTGVTVGR